MALTLLTELMSSLRIQGEGIHFRRGKSGLDTIVLSFYPHADEDVEAAFEQMLARSLWMALPTGASPESPVCRPAILRMYGSNEDGSLHPRLVDIANLEWAMTRIDVDPITLARPVRWEHDNEPYGIQNQTYSADEMPDFVECWVLRAELVIPQKDELWAAKKAEDFEKLAQSGEVIFADLELPTKKWPDSGLDEWELRITS